MTESYITFDTAKLAKEKGIHLTDEMNCFGGSSCTNGTLPQERTSEENA